MTGPVVGMLTDQDVGHSAVTDHQRDKLSERGGAAHTALATMSLLGFLDRGSAGRVVAMASDGTQRRLVWPT
jgi:hypothetical protein